jgi:hypothetical protein
MLATSPWEAGDRKPASERKRTRLNTANRQAEQVLLAPMGQVYLTGSLLLESLDASRLPRTDGFSSKSRFPYFQHESSRTRICQ